MATGSGRHGHKPRNAGASGELEEVTRDPLPEPSEGQDPDDALRSDVHEKQAAVVLSHLLCGNLLWQPQDLTPVPGMVLSWKRTWHRDAPSVSSLCCGEISGLGIHTEHGHT